MHSEPRLANIMADASTACGFGYQMRWDPPGILEVPGQEAALVAVHLGAAARLTCWRDGRRLTGTAVHGDIDIIPAHTPGRWEMHDANDRALLIRLPETLLRAVAHESGFEASRLELRDRFQVRDPELETLCFAVMREMELQCPTGRLYMDGLALAVASRVVARHSSITKVAERNGGLTGRRLKQVLAFIEEQISQDLSLERIAEVAGMSPSHVNTLFRKATGLPIHQYVIQRRVERAKALLSKNGMSMAEIALAAGFAHQSHMARHMRRVLGVPPRVMKRLLRVPLPPR